MTTCPLQVGALPSAPPRGVNTVPPLTRGSAFMASVTRSQLWPENINWKMPEMNNWYIQNCVPFE